MKATCLINLHYFEGIELLYSDCCLDTFIFPSELVLTMPSVSARQTCENVNETHKHTKLVFDEKMVNICLQCEYV